MRPPDGIGSAFLFPLVALAVVYALVGVAGRYFNAREEHDTGERMADIGFGVGCLAAVYTLVLLIVSVISLPDLVIDLIKIVLVLGAFFGLLLSVLFGLFELLIGRGGRAQPLPVAERNAGSNSG